MCYFYYSLTFFPEPEIYSRMPRTLTTTINDHVSKPHGARDHYGARCAGQVAARKNNACGVGIAYDSKATGIRILGGRITTTDEATGSPMITTRLAFIASGGGAERQRSECMLQNIFSGKLFQKASAVDDKQKGLYTHLQAAMVEGMKTSAISMATRIVSTL